MLINLTILNLNLAILKMKIFENLSWFSFV
jgi:hypothetical protein